MGKSETKFIESSLDAFRSIKTFLLLDGIYPKNFSTGFWNEEDFYDPDYRRSMYDEFGQYLNMLANIHNLHIKALYEAIPQIEIEYNNIVVNSHNMKQAIKLFKDKYEKAMIVIEKEMDMNKLLLHYLNPLKKHEIISQEEGNDYMDIVCRIGMVYNDAVNTVCDVFGLERPWNQNNPNTNIIPQQDNGSDEHTNSELDNAENVNTYRSKSLSRIDFSSMISFNPINDEAPNLSILYRYLVNTKTISKIDQGVFENCVSHAYFSPIYINGNKVNILYAISQLKVFYEGAWLESVCTGLNVDRKRITQRLPSNGFRNDFPSLKQKK